MIYMLEVEDGEYVVKSDEYGTEKIDDHLKRVDKEVIKNEQRK